MTAYAEIEVKNVQAHFFEPSRGSVMLLIERDDPQIPAIGAAVQAVKLAAFGPNVLFEPHNLFFRDGDLKPWPEFHGKFFLRCVGGPIWMPGLEVVDNKVSLPPGALVNARLLIYPGFVARDETWTKRIEAAPLRIEIA